MVRGACGNPETPCGPSDMSHEKTEWTHKDDEARAEWERFFAKPPMRAGVTRCQAVLSRLGRSG